MISALTAAAAALPQATSGIATPSWAPIVFQFGLIALIFYFIIIRPQQKQRREHEDADRKSVV